jgi:hypothetical protein
MSTTSPPESHLKTARGGGGIRRGLLSLAVATLATVFDRGCAEAQGLAPGAPDG